jgi:hypothetical protein
MGGDLLGAPDGDFLTIEEARRASAQDISRTLAPLPITLLYIMGSDDLVRTADPDRPELAEARKFLHKPDR